MFIDFHHLKDFTDLLGYKLDEGGIPVVLKEGYIAVEMEEICDACGIDMEEIFDKE